MARKYVNLSSYLKDGKNTEFSRLVEQVFWSTSWISQEYPNYVEKYYTKYIPGIFDGTREIIICMDDSNVVGIATLKKTKEERKICTLFVADPYRLQGIGRKLLGKAFKWLETTSPVISMASRKTYMFKAIIDYYEWQITSEHPKGEFNKRFDEVVFNEKLS